MGCCAWCAMCSISLVGLGSMRVVMLFGLSSIRRRRSWVGSSPPYRPYLPPHTLPLVWAKFRYLSCLSIVSCQLLVEINCRPRTMDQRLRTDMPIALHDPLVARQLAQRHRAAHMQLLSADGDLRAEAKLPTVVEARRSVDEH